jgi:hypothetical protein
MATLPKWTEDRTNALVAAVGDASPVTQEMVATIAVELETTNRSISSKLRKMGYDVELASAGATKTFTDEQADALGTFVVDNSGAFTYAEVAAAFDGAFTAKQVQGKILSMELTSHVKPTPKAEAVRTYTEEEEEIFLSLVAKNAFLEEIAEAVGKSLNSVRGKALSFLRAEQITSIPKQRDVKGKEKVDALDALGDVSAYTVETLATELGKTARGIRTMLTRRGVTVSDYDGAARKAKATA